MSDIPKNFSIDIEWFPINEVPEGMPCRQVMLWYPTHQAMFTGWIFPTRKIGELPRFESDRTQCCYKDCKFTHFGIFKYPKQ